MEASEAQAIRDTIAEWEDEELHPLRRMLVEGELSRIFEDQLDNAAARFAVMLTCFREVDAGSRIRLPLEDEAFDMPMKLAAALAKLNMGKWIMKKGAELLKEGPRDNKD